MWNVVGK